MSVEQPDIVITGMGAVGPTGIGISDFKRALWGCGPSPEAWVHPATQRSYQVNRVDVDACMDRVRSKTLRRAASISVFSVAAAQEALRNAGIQVDDTAGNEQGIDSTAVIVATSHACLSFSRVFHQQSILDQPPIPAPATFADSVYNAMGSHISMSLGLKGRNMTLLGDWDVGIQALQVACEMLRTGEVERALIVGADELDEILIDCFVSLRLVRESESQNCAKMILSEGSGAILLETAQAAHRRGADAIARVRAVHTGSLPKGHKKNENLSADISRFISGVCNGVTTTPVMSGANGSWVGEVELEGIAKVFQGNGNFSKTPVSVPKTFLGEGFAASSVWLLIAAVIALCERKLPPTAPGFNSLPEGLECWAEPTPLGSESTDFLVSSLGPRGFISAALLQR